MPTPSTGAKKIVKRIYYRIRNNQWIYLNLINFREKRLVKKSLGSSLHSTQGRILQELRSNGIAFSNLLEIFPERDFLSEFQKWIEKSESNLRQRSKKKFLLSYYGTDAPDREIDLSNPFVKFYLNDKILSIACQYLGYVPQLFEVYIEKTIPLSENTPQFSQNWHRDPEEKRTIKVFVYLNDVDENSGPFTYVKKSAPSNDSPYSRLFPQDLPWGSYPSASDVQNSVEKEDLLVATAKQGTVIFCDTSGLHKGGHAVKNYRIMSTGFYPSKHYTEPRPFATPKSNLLEKDFSKLAKAVLNK